MRNQQQQTSLDLQNEKIALFKAQEALTELFGIMQPVEAAEMTEKFFFKYIESDDFTRSLTTIERSNFIFRYQNLNKYLKSLQDYYLTTGII